MSDRIGDLLKGAIDLHCHSGPSVMPRSLNHVEAIKEGEAAGLRAILFKDHYYSVTPVAALLDEIIVNYQVDRDRIYLTGLSMGGYGTWTLAAAYPEKFAAIAPICGGGWPEDAARLKDLPIWVFHGAKDEAVPLERSEEMVKAVEDAGGKVKFTVYLDAEHDSWTATYGNPELYEWLLAQKRRRRQ